jgi:hypothetical protein
VELTLSLPTNVRLEQFLPSNDKHTSLFMISEGYIKSLKTWLPVGVHQSY